MNYRTVLVWGCMSASIFGVILFAIAGVHKLVQYYGFVALGALVVSIILSGAMLSGDRLRAYYNTEDPADRTRRNDLIGKLLLFASPYAAIAGVLYFFIKM